MDRSYLDNPHYFPGLSRDRAQEMLGEAEAGTFLLRDSSKDNCLVISLKQDGRVLHLLLPRKGDKYGLDPEAWKGHSIATETFSTIEMLLSRLRQYRGMLKTGLVRPGAAASSPDAMGAQGRDELKRVLEYSETLEHEYKGLLQGMLMGDEHLSTDEIAALAQWRERHHFSDQQHEKVLGLLNITPAKYEAMKASGNKSNADDEKNLCVICCDSPKSTVFVDCGHLATCLACAQNPALKACPICRVPKNKFIRVYT